jgi:long-subunit fatty acid transport protein
MSSSVSRRPPLTSPLVVPLLLVLLVPLAPRPATAGPFDVFGFGSRAIALGGAATALADDYTATFYNPANLVRRKSVHLGAEVVTSFPSLEIRLSNPDARSAPVEADSFTGLGLGVLFPLGGKIGYPFALGLVLYLPADQLLRVDALDPLIPRWYLWDSLADKMQILFGVGIEITDWLSVGAGVQTLANVRGTADIEIELINEQFVRRDINVDLINTLAPILGVHLGPWEGLQFGFSWRSELDLTFDLPIRLDLGEAIDLGFTNRGQALYTPHTLSFGAAWRIAETGWTVAAETRYLLWSNAPDPAFNFAVDVSGELVDGLGFEDALDLLPGPSGLPGLRDTWTAHLGAEYWANDHVVGRAGYQYRRTPVPDQVGLTNYVDSDTHTVSLGLGLTYPDPLNLDAEPVTLEVTAALSLFPEAQTIKASPNDPVGNFTAGGEVVTLSFSIRHDF